MGKYDLVSLNNLLETFFSCRSFRDATKELFEFLRCCSNQKKSYIGFVKVASQKM